MHAGLCAVGGFRQCKGRKVEHHAEGFERLEALRELGETVYEFAINDLPLGFGDELFIPLTERRNHSIVTAARGFNVDSRVLREKMRMQSTETTLLWTEARRYLGVRLAIWNVLSKSGLVPLSSAGVGRCQSVLSYAGSR